MNIQKYSLFACIILLSTHTFANSVSCDTNPDFTKNGCDVCFQGGEAKVTSKGITLINKKNLPWKNTSTTHKQVFYKNAQQQKELITNYGTVSDTWLGKGISWDTGITWEDTDGQQTYNLEIGKEFPLRTIDANTVVPINGYSTQSSGFILVKIPVSFYEIDDATFERSEVINKNYCVSYIPKTDGSSSSTPIPTPTITSSSITPKVTPPPPPQPTTTHTNITTVTDIPEIKPLPISTSSNPTPSFTSNTPIPHSLDNKEISNYNTQILLNSANKEERVGPVTQVEVGPGDNLLLFLAACALSLLCYSKVNTYFNRG